MKNNRGQALVEFALILPIFLLLVFAVIDFGSIVSKKFSLQSDLDLVVDLYQKKDLDAINNYVSNNKLNIEYKEDNNFLTISLSKSLNLITPGLNNVLKNPYIVYESVTIINE